MVDGSPMDNLARLVNRSCEPNCEAVVDEEERTVTYIVARDIEPGEELTVSYGPDYIEAFVGDGAGARAAARRRSM